MAYYVHAKRTNSRGIVIEDAFIKEWHPKYDLTEDDEEEYRRLLAETWTWVIDRAVTAYSMKAEEWYWSNGWLQPLAYSASSSSSPTK